MAENALTIINLLITLNGQTQSQKKRIGMERYQKRERKEKEQSEVKNKHEEITIDNSYYPPSPQYVPSSDNFVPTFTDTLVPVPEEREEEQQQRQEGQEEEDKLGKEERENKESDYDINDTITVMRAEY